MRKKTETTLPAVPVTDYAAEGKALGKVDGKVIFIEGAVPGDVVDVTLGKNKKDWAEGKATRFLSLSPDRVEPFCPHFGICGGCKWQMLPYDRQLMYKEREVIENLTRLGKVELPPVQPIMGGEATRYYRNKLEFTFSNKRYRTDEEMRAFRAAAPAAPVGTRPAPPPAEPALGFHVPRLFDKVIDIRECHLQAEPSDHIRNTVRAFALEQGYTFYDIKQHTGWLRNLVVRVCTTGEVMVNLVLGYEDRAEGPRLMDHLLRQAPEISTLLYTINPKWNDSIHDLEPVTYYGPGHVIEQLGDYRFKISPKSFFQTNTRQAERLYSVVRDFAGLSGTETLYDLYCGTGSIGIYLSAGAARVVGVEVIGDAIRDAEENARLNGITHARFFTGDVVDVCNDVFFREQGRPDVIITDPPRAGMHEQLVRKLLEIGAPRVVYVSCNVATQARDLQLLDERYRVARVQPVDLFPHTHHIENVVALELR
ncbi:MAG TPA: 23S rRNA (uracil(1939)-C(5))-methyltransferase RlmD [Dinghuibacter sp.]|uniref:23S rRNA (uracil(1939)-C(5))-methyltransferase RlmD n=1 Tax=Dinghuibacter sp. TaxID=2024697 RepID=UPI002C8F2B35|nr:23S rRNA (uracil(1939)-C(5))-methyltransferase RlmD [Dinghuibacter sp.]HTJ10719.1 23S rRNA (uracil(1939)-C(5))-methyltransferase RlmD [Dinghuibacter sp.]